MIKRLPIIIFIFIIFYIYFKDDVFKDKTIVIGASLPNSGIIKSWGDAVTSGVNSYFKYANENHLLKNRMVTYLP